MGTYTTRKRIVSGRKNKVRSPNTQLFQEGTPSPPAKVTTNALRTSPRSATKKTGSYNITGLEQKANFDHFTNTFLASPSKSKLGKPCTGFTTKETNRMTRLTKYSKDRIDKMIAELGKNMSTSAPQKDVIGIRRTACKSSTIQPRKLTYHRRATQFSKSEVINTQPSPFPDQSEQVWKLQHEEAAGAMIRSGDRSARMTNFPGFKIKQLLKANSLDQVIACHIQGDAREELQQMLRYQTILKNVGTEIIELGSEEENTEGLPDPVIGNEDKPSKLLPLAGLMMAQNRQHEEELQISNSDHTPATSTSSQTTAGIQPLAQLFQNGIKIENSAAGDPCQNYKRLTIWTKEGKYSIVTGAGGNVQEGFAVRKVLSEAGTPDDPVVIEDD